MISGRVYRVCTCFCVGRANNVITCDHLHLPYAYLHMLNILHFTYTKHYLPQYGPLIDLLHVLGVQRPETLPGYIFAFALPNCIAVSLPIVASRCRLVHWLLCMCLNRLSPVIWVRGIITFMSHVVVHVRSLWGVEGMGQWIGYLLYNVWHALLMWLLPVLNVTFTHWTSVCCHACRLCIATLKCDRALVAHLSHSMDHYQ